MSYTMRFFYPVFILFLLLAAPAISRGANVVEEAINAIKEQLAGGKAAQEAPKEEEGMTVTMPESDSEPAASEQATYPGIRNMRIERGGNGVPAISIYYPALGNPAIDQNLREFAEKLADNYEKDVEAPEESGEERPDSYGNWEETGFFTVERPGPDVISITFNIYSFMGGAHGQLLIDVRNYDLKNGKQLDFADLFADPEKALEILGRISAERLRESLGDDAEEEMIRAGTEPTIANFDNLSLLANGVAVEFQPYQVGPWAIGQQRVEISLRELAPAGPSKFVWPEQKQEQDPS